MASDTKGGDVSAGKQAERIRDRLEKLEEKISWIESHRGTDVAHLDSLDRIKDERTKLIQEFDGAWVNRYERPVEEARTRARDAKQRAASAIRSRDEINVAEQHRIQDAQRELVRGINNQNLSGADERALRESIESSKRRITDAEKAVGDSDAAAEQAHLDAAGLQTEVNRASLERNEALQGIFERTSTLVAEATKLYGDIESRSVGVAKDLVESNRTEFVKALKYHRDQSSYANISMIVAAFFFLVLVFALFFTQWVDRPHTLTRAGVIDWGAVVLVLGGRFAILGAGAGLIVFFGRLHSRHSQQAVTYQSRLAALDIASTLLAYSSPAGREDTLKGMSVFYRTHGDNAFAGATAAVSHRSFERLTRTVARLTKTLGGDVLSK